MRLDPNDVLNFDIAQEATAGLTELGFVELAMDLRDPLVHPGKSGTLKNTVLSTKYFDPERSGNIILQETATTLHAGPALCLVIRIRLYILLVNELTITADFAACPIDSSAAIFYLEADGAYAGTVSGAAIVGQDHRVVHLNCQKVWTVH